MDRFSSSNHGAVNVNTLSLADFSGLFGFPHPRMRSVTAFRHPPRRMRSLLHRRNFIKPPAAAGAGSNDRTKARNGVTEPKHRVAEARRRVSGRRCWRIKAGGALEGDDGHGGLSPRQPLLDRIADGGKAGPATPWSGGGVPAMPWGRGVSCDRQRGVSGVRLSENDRRLEGDQSSACVGAAKVPRQRILACL